MTYFTVQKQDEYIVLTTEDNTILYSLLQDMYNQNSHIDLGKIKIETERSNQCLRSHAYLPIVILDWLIWLDIERKDTNKPSYFEPTFLGTFDHFKLEVKTALKFCKVKEDPYFYQSINWYFAETSQYKFSYEIDNQEYTVFEVGSADLVYETNTDLCKALVTLRRKQVAINNLA